MKAVGKAAIALATVALGATPAVALSAGNGNPPSPPTGTTNPGSPPTDTGPNTNTAPTPSTPTRPTPTPPSWAKALGVTECQDFKNFKGKNNKQEFGQCISDVAKALRTNLSPTVTCRNLSRRRQPGQKRSDYTACVLAGKHAEQVLEQLQQPQTPTQTQTQPTPTT